MNIGQRNLPNVKLIITRLKRCSSPVVQGIWLVAFYFNVMGITLDPEQHQVLTSAYKAGQQFGATPREMKALTEALLVESNIRNLPGGDRDSRGALQQRPSQGWLHPTNVGLAVRDFLTHARQNKSVRGSAGALAQSVQRSALPGRYDAASGAANALLQTQNGGSSQYSSSGSLSSPGQQTVNDPQAMRRVALAQHLERTDPGSMLLRLGVVSPTESTSKVVNRSLATGRSSPLVAGQSGNNDTTTNGVINRLVSRATAINAKHLPYQYGGGHAGLVNPQTTGPLDCSGAVSAVLGVNPRVSGDFAKWGSPGAGKRVTIYANGSHTLMSIDGHFFGTSGSNPGGGAGWIPHAQVSRAYLQNFVARHPQGM
jgi:hypothetical protein